MQIRVPLRRAENLERCKSLDEVSEKTSHVVLLACSEIRYGDLIARISISRLKSCQESLSVMART